VRLIAQRLDQLPPRRDTQLAVRGRQVTLHRPHRQHELVGDVLVAQALLASWAISASRRVSCSGSSAPRASAVPNDRLASAATDLLWPRPRPLALDLVGSPSSAGAARGNSAMILLTGAAGVVQVTDDGGHRLWSRLLRRRCRRPAGGRVVYWPESRAC
jgi:hypothetical protein